MISVVTSCSLQGWKEYGRRFVESFFRFWPREIALHIVSEDSLPATGAVYERHEPGGPIMWDLWRASPVAYEYHDRHCSNPRPHGRVQLAADVGWTPKKRANGYNFRYDAYRFAKKVFAIDLVAKNLKGGRLFWIDADVVTFAPVPVDLLERLLPPEAAISCLDRGHYHSECGFVGYNLDHPQCREFIERFANLYSSDQVLDLQEWHDSWVFDWLRRRTEIPTFAIPHNSRHHPFVNSELGSCLDHLKGSRKAKGKTPASEVLSGKKRALPYWSAPA